ncbi:Peptidoglycan glycosyltransferase [Xylanimonas cellulosilytica DSM 15894]|uniref:Peptidoglycan glycosyltransferase n=1 Tax=Xylanimonas cellulosilytica (strain DSM 15894 / JCM 12276 / CECT 5975 / KCTC 9989 / LMG 20990 / NBRC 107835 / XIL07) TaxID=446471 RepID=D1BTB9_XYLCX|nr:penicillin-binding transpeptidase domain-containing protein [Xylanimonas cellulosilytica]ACZ29061.1 Peptidoglycan glycosyltransferase [Xylanimonas cellulosilytica DSM 15894]
MNTTLRRLSSVVMVMFLGLMVATTYTQFFRADTLNNDSRNVRSIFREFNNARGPIVVAGQPIVESVPVDTPFGFQRVYSGGDPEQAQMYAPVTGFFSLVNGSTAIESATNSFLNGQADALWIDRLQNLLTGRPQQGSSVELTIDPVIQQAAWDALGGQRGAIVAVEPSTGRILAMVSKPSFDPNVLAVHSTSQAGQAYQELLNAENGPLTNRTIRALYPPGSTFKLVTAAAAFEHAGMTPETVIPAPDSFVLPGTQTTVRNFGNARCSPTGEQSIDDAMRISCNSAFLGLAVDLGNDTLRDTAAQFGFLDPFRVPMTTAVSDVPADQNAPQTALAGIGQGSVTATPLQMAMVSAAIANHGTLMQPYLVDRIRDPELEIVQQNEPSVIREAVSRTTADGLRDMMVNTVASGSGTAAQISGVQVAGKTGTAETGREGEQPHAWFTAFAPADDPQIALAVIVENGGNLSQGATGGRLAAPMARSVLQAALNR